MQVLYDIFDVPTPQKFIERTSMVTRKKGNVLKFSG